MDRLSFVLYRLLGSFVRLLPLKAGWWLGHLLGSVCYYLAGPYRRLAIHNLRIAFPEKSMTERRTIARQHFALLGANILSGFKLPALSREQLLSVVTAEGLEHMDEQLKAGGGFVFVISHLGNWEMFAELAVYLYQCKVGTIYQALGNRFIDAEVRRDRARLGLALFERKEGFGGAAKFIREGGAVGVLIDQHAGDAGLWCPFFGRLASTTTLTATLAARTGGWLIPAAVHSDGPARWRIVLRPRIDPAGLDTEGITLRCNEVVEEQIRVQPADWFWVHNRWKTPKPKFLLATYKRGVEPGEKKLQPFRIVIRSSNWLGDAVMSMPAVRAIKRGRPDAHVTILTPAKLADLWRTVAEVDDLILIESGDSVFTVAGKLRDRFDVAVIFPNSLRTALEPWLAGIPRRVGYPGHRRVRLLNQVFREKKSKKPKAPRHQVHHYLALAEFIGADITGALAPEIRNSKSEIRNPRIGLVPGAEYGPAKRWLPERFAEVMKAVPGQWVIFGVAKDREVTDTILAQLPQPPTPAPIDLVGKTTLAELVEHLRQCDLILTNDTGTMHLAASLGVPVVALFGSTAPDLTGPLGERHTIIRHHVECSPCFLRECPIDFRCMKQIEAAEVIEAINARLAQRAGV